MIEYGIRRKWTEGYVECEAVGDLDLAKDFVEQYEKYDAPFAATIVKREVGDWEEFVGARVDDGCVCHPDVTFRAKGAKK